MQNLFKVLMIAVLIISFNSCSPNGVNLFSEPEIQQTFLEKYNGTSWLYTNDLDTTYLRIINNKTAPFETWGYYVEGKCFDYYLYDLNVLLGQVENNSTNVMHITLAYETYTIEMYLSIIYENLYFQQDQYRDGEYTTISNDKYLRQNVDVLDGLILCD